MRKFRSSRVTDVVREQYIHTCGVCEIRKGSKRFQMDLVVFIYL